MHIDDLITSRAQKRTELSEIGQQIASSAMPTVIVFVDLADSTSIKHESPAEEWLGYVFEFIRYVEQYAKASEGTVVKRIGDELMITFKSVGASASFVDSLVQDSALQKYEYKVALDFGDAYHFRFIEHLEDDPYGPVVDRCARIATYARSGTAICTKPYHEKLNKPENYISVGSFALKGFSEPEELLVRPLVSIDNEEFLKPLVTTTNEGTCEVQGYRLITRKLTAEFIRDFGKDARNTVRPFLARELLNVPRLPYSPAEFGKAVGDGSNTRDKEKEFLGYFVEWVGKYDHYTRREYALDVILKIGSFGDTFTLLNLRLPSTYFDIVRELEAGQLIRARGIIDDIYLGIISLNYVDLEILPASDTES